MEYTSILIRYEFLKKIGKLTPIKIIEFLDILVKDKNINIFKKIYNENELIITEKDLYLHKSCYWGNLEIVQYLIEKKNYNYNYLTNLNNPPIYFSLSNNHNNIINYLLKFNIDFSLLSNKLDIKKKINNIIIFPILSIKYNKLLKDINIFNKIWKYY